MINSRQKGKIGELEAVHYLSNLGLKCHRTQQYCGKTGKADIEFEDENINKLLHVEVKRNETLNIEKALEQAERDVEHGKYALVLHRKNRDYWKVTMRADDFFRLLFRNKNRRWV